MILFLMLLMFLLHPMFGLLLFVLGFFLGFGWMFTPTF